MSILYLALLSIPLSFLCGGRLKYMAEKPLRLVFLPLVSFAVELAFPLLQKYIELPVSKWLWIAVLFEYSLLFLFCLLNWRWKPIRLIALACLMNFFVIAWYGFRMPVAPIAQELAAQMPEAWPGMAQRLSRIESGELFEYVLVESGSPFLFLGDALVIPFMHSGLASIGDLLLVVGVSWLIIEWMRPVPIPKQPAAYHRSA